MAETFNPIISHLYCGQGGTSTEVTKYNNATISEINVVDSGVTTKYDFGYNYTGKMYSGDRVWNQLVQMTTSSSGSENGVTFTVSGESISVSTVVGGATGYTFRDINPAFSMVSGHKYCVYGLPIGLSTSTCYIYLLGGGVSPNQFASNAIVTCTSNTSTAKFRISVEQGVVITTPLVFKFQMFDITNIYGAGNEPTTVAEFIQDYNKEYYPYDPGTVFSYASRLLNTIKQPLDSVTFYGNSMRWCQLVQNGNFADTSGWTITNGTITTSDNVAEVTFTDTTAASSLARSSFSRLAGHKYFCFCQIKLKNTFSQTGATFGFSGISNAYVNGSTTEWQTLSYIDTETANRSTFLPSLYKWAQTALTGYFIKNFMIIDLTYIFGAGNEPTTVFDFTRRLKKLYYPFTNGEILSIEKATGYLYGINIWDEEWELGQYDVTNGEKTTSSIKIRSKNSIRVSPNTNYYFVVPNTIVVGNVNVCYYDGGNNFISFASGATNPKTTPSNASYMTFYLDADYGTTYNNDICINLSDSSINGTYEASKGEQSMRLLSTNIYDRRLDTTGYGLNGSGNIELNNKRVVSDYIDISGASYISMNYGATYAFYNESKVFISGETKSFSVFRSYAIPSGAKYVRIDNVLDTISGQGVMIVLGQYTSETLPSYVPYGYGYATLNGVGDAIDTVTVNKNNTGSYIRKIGMYTFTGNEVVYSYGGGYYFDSSVFSQTPKLPTMNIVCPVLYATNAPSDVQTDSSAICFYGNGYIYIGTSPANLVGVTLYYELATPVETALTAEQCAEILNGAFTKSKYSTILIDNDNGQIDQTVDVGVWKQR